MERDQRRREGAGDSAVGTGRGGDARAGGSVRDRIGKVVRAECSEGAAAFGVVANVVLSAVKLGAGVAGGSSALVADGVESLVDVAGSVIVWGALRYGSRPADEGHPFGHGKAEALGALAVGVIVVSAGVMVGGYAVAGLVAGSGAVPAWWTLAVLVAVVVVKEALYRRAMRAARRSGSSAGVADAWHHRSDAITSLAAGVGITAALVGGSGWAGADEWAALVASGVIVFNGIRLMAEPVSELMDAGAPEVAARCVEAVLGVEGILGVERCEARKVGRGYRVVMHAEVDGSMPVRRAHALTGAAKAAVREAVPGVESLLIHVEPHGE